MTLAVDNKDRTCYLASYSVGGEGSGNEINVGFEYRKEFRA